MDFHRKSAHLKLRSELEKEDSFEKETQKQQLNGRPSRSARAITLKGGEHASFPNLNEMLTKQIIDELS